MHDITLITTLAGALGVALVLGALTRALKLSTLVGYLIAGVLVGPHTPGFVADPKLAAQLAEVGVVLLMFGVGLHFHPEELLRVWRIAVPGAIAQSAVAVAAGWALMRAFGWSNGAGLVIGMGLAVASTVVLMRMLDERGRLREPDGHVAVGWLIVEDILTVVALVLMPALAAETATPLDAVIAAGEALAKVAAFAALAWLIGTRFISPLTARVASTESTELFTLTIFVVALGVAAIAATLFHVSVALGAFLAGLVVGQGRAGRRAEQEILPFRDVFAALFFVSVGMLFDPSLLLREPRILVAALAIVLLVKPAVAWLVVRVLRGRPQTGRTVAVGLAQIGEFSFILASLAMSLGVLPNDGLDVLVAVALVSIAVNPLLFRLVKAPRDAPVFDGGAAQSRK